MGDYHRFLVHFPVALLVAGFLFDLWAHASGRQDARHAARYTLILGLAGALAALVTGMAAGNRLAARVADAGDPTAGYVLGLLHAHRLLALVSLAAFAGLLAWRRRLGDAPAGRPASMYMVAAALAAGLMLTAAMYGGKIAHRDRPPQPPHEKPPAPLPPFPAPPAP